jgi:hypothetical protein
MTDRAAQVIALRSRLLRTSAAGAAGIVLLGAAGAAAGVVVLSGGHATNSTTTGGEHPRPASPSRRQGSSKSPAIGTAPVPAQPQAGSNGS